MAKESFQLDPNAVAYTDDEIIGKVNAATAKVTREDAVSSPAVDLSGKSADDVVEGTVNKYDTGVPPSNLEELPDGATRKAMMDAEKTKLTGIEENAKDDQSGAEVRDAILELADVDRKIVITDPQTGEKPILAIQRQADGKLDIDNDDQPVA